MKVVAIIEARMESTRLPGKSLKKICGKPMLELMIERIKNSKNIDEIVIATSTNLKNDEIEKLSKKLEVTCFRGSEEDVLDRVLNAAISCHAEIILELWGDCPLIDPNILDGMIDYFFDNEYDCIGTVLPNFKKTYPLGISALIFKTQTLQEIDNLTKNPIDRENVSNYIYEHPKKYRIASFPCPKNLRYPNLRLVVDEYKDFELVKAVFEYLYPSNKNFSTIDVIEYLNSHPKIRDMNKHVMQRTLPKWDKLKKNTK